MTELHDLLDYDNDNEHDHRFAEHDYDCWLTQYSPTENPEAPLKKGDLGGFSSGYKSPPPPFTKGGECKATRDPEP
ncbi:MAG: hypothetical protein JRK53_13365 [Deltaproteobacteria bacterium]|nr:hypothetical protein [Deltaproteobacteria bacterium]